MKITRISVYQADLPLKKPYFLSGGKLRFDATRQHHRVGRDRRRRHRLGRGVPLGRHLSAGLPRRQFRPEIRQQNNQQQERDAP